MPSHRQETEMKQESQQCRRATPGGKRLEPKHKYVDRQIAPQWPEKKNNNKQTKSELGEGGLKR